MSVSMGSVSPRSHVESNNNNKSLVFVTVVGLICSILFTFVRYYYNHQDRRKWTEYFGLLALIVALGHAASMFISTKYGLGQSFSTVTLEQHWGMETAYLIAQITLYISLGLSKLDWFLLLHTIFLTGPNTRPVLTRITTGLIVISTILSVLSVSIECLHRGLSPEKPSETCSGIPTRYLVVFILDITTDLFLVLLPSYLIMPVQMKRKKKLKFAGIFALRLTLVAPATMSFVFWQDTLHSRNLETVRANALAIQAAQLWFSIILCMATRLIKLIRCFNTYSGMGPGFPEPSDQGGCELDTATSTRNGSSSMPEIVWESGLQRCTQEKDSESQKSTAALCKPQRCA